MGDSPETVLQGYEQKLKKRIQNINAALVEANVQWSSLTWKLVAHALGIAAFLELDKDEKFAFSQKGWKMFDINATEGYTSVSLRDENIKTSDAWSKLLDTKFVEKLQKKCFSNGTLGAQAERKLVEDLTQLSFGVHAAGKPAPPRSLHIIVYEKAASLNTDNPCVGLREIHTESAKTASATAE